MNKIASGWKAEFNYSKAENGRVWVIWDSNTYEVNKISEEAQYIHCSVVNRQMNVDCEMTVIYGYNTVEQRKILRDQLRKLSQTSSKPWILWGISML